MMKARKWISVVCAASLAVSLAACGAQADADSAETTLTGQISEMDGDQVTLQLGTITETQTGAPPESRSGGEDGQTPPEKPEDKTTADSSGASDGKSGSIPPEDAAASGSGENKPPEKPEDSNGGSGQTPPEGAAPGGSTFEAGEESVILDFSETEITKNEEAVTLEDLSVGDVLTVTVENDTTAVSAVVETLGGGFGGSGQINQGTSANVLTEDGTYTDTAYTSTGDDENALRVDGAAVTLEGVTVEKTGGATSNTEDGDFYGMNAALLATNGASVTIKNASVTSSAQNGNGVFSYGSGTVVKISDSTITTTADNSGGIQTTGGGTTYAENLTVETSGNSSAAIRSDRGGGTVNVTGGTYTSNGCNSPAVYSTAEITVKDAVLTAKNSEALVIEGKNSIALENCAVTGNMSDTQGASSDENVHNVMIYQSMSGDADVGTSTFSMRGGSLTAKNGDMFYVTNTHCVMTLSGAALKNEDADACLLRVVGNSGSRGWGTAGTNGAQVECTADGQTLEGSIVVDTISTLNLTLKNGSVFTGTVNIVENEQGGTAVSDNAAVTVESGCTWTLTGDCTLTSLVNNGTIVFNGHTITLADGTVLR